MALGAAPADLMRSVLARGLRLASLGVVLGLCAAWGLMSLLKSVLYKTSPHDPSTLATAAFLLIAVALLACWLPAKRASKIDPALVLRSE
jgi:ABC-type antimicrobial peptide transport system permease subunit